MHPFLLVATLYFLVSFSITLTAILGMKKIGEKVPAVTFMLLFLFAPLLVGMIAILKWIYPPSADPFDLVYTKLSFSEEKSAAQIAEEIKAEGHTVGGSRNETKQVAGVLDAMVVMGFARSRQVLLKEASAAHFGAMAEQYGEVDEELKADLEKLVADAEADGADDLVYENVYLRGNPPNKRGKWQRLLLTHGNFRPVAIRNRY